LQIKENLVDSLFMKKTVHGQPHAWISYLFNVILHELNIDSFIILPMEVHPASAKTKPVQAGFKLFNPL
jgi:hypothetical protein